MRLLKKSQNVIARSVIPHLSLRGTKPRSNLMTDSGQTPQSDLKGYPERDSSVAEFTLNAGEVLSQNDRERKVQGDTLCEIATPACSADRLPIWVDRNDTKILK